MEKAWVQQRKDENQQDQKDERREQPYVVKDIFSITKHVGRSRREEGSGARSLG
jgi:hypothetical protein